MVRGTIRNADDEVKSRLRVRAAGNGRSMEEQARLSLRDTAGHKPNCKSLASIMHGHFERTNGVDLELLPREPAREPPSFD